MIINFFPILCNQGEENRNTAGFMKTIPSVYTLLAIPEYTGSYGTVFRKHMVVYDNIIYN